MYRITRMFLPKKSQRKNDKMTILLDSSIDLGFEPSKPKIMSTHEKKAL